MYCKHVAQNDKRLSAVLDPHLPRFGLSRAGYLGHRAGTRVDFWLGALCFISRSVLNMPCMCYSPSIKVLLD